MTHNHAYLILAHNDVPLLERLISCLDDKRNDIYVHWDAKSGSIPSIKTSYSRLCFLEDRIEVNWAGYSIVEAEYLLFKKAFVHGPYDYYHLLSGADLPIKPQDYIHQECERMAGAEFIAFADAPQTEIDYRVQHYFLFPEEFKGTSIVKRTLRKVLIRLQDLTCYHRTDTLVRKGSQWCSVTHDFVRYLLSQEAKVKKLFEHTFCPDELFVQTICFNSPFKEKVKSAEAEFEGNMRFIKWENGELLPIEETDLPSLKASDRWFARKFSGKDRILIDKVLELSK